jgi:DNA-binding Xre family transcriptional regulator
MDDDYIYPNTVNIDEILAERNKTHGDYTKHAWITQALKMVIRSENKILTADQAETLDMICHKIGRILAGNPEVADHWDDIAGYAKLTADRIRQRAK